MSKRILANNKEDIASLARAILLTPIKDRWKVLGHIFDSDLIKFKGFNGFLLVLVKKYRGRVGIFSFMNLLDKIYPQALKDFLLSTSYHLLYGKDTEDSDSVGGWSQREIDLLLSYIKFTSLEEDYDKNLQEPV